MNLKKLQGVPNFRFPMILLLKQACIFRGQIISIQPTKLPYSYNSKSGVDIYNTFGKERYSMKVYIIRHGDPDYSIDSFPENGWKEGRFGAIRENEREKANMPQDISDF